MIKTRKRYRILKRDRICSLEGCNELGLWRTGERINKRLCLNHYIGLVPTAFNDANKRRLRQQGFTDKCMVCGWDKEKCDIHCIISKKEGGRYEKSNVISLCPNCHRLLHRKKLSIGVKELQVLVSHCVDKDSDISLDKGSEGHTEEPTGTLDKGHRCRH